MAFGIRPATPGTLVVLAATVLLVLVSVSVPITKSIWFLKADIKATVDGVDINGVVTLGCWGYCIGDNCTQTKLGYNLDILKLFGSSGQISGISNSVLKWITYILILHPVAAALAAVSTILGLLAHLRGFAGTCFTTCVSSLAATVALLAFVFDIVVFLIAKKRIESAAGGQSAQLGNAVWMTLAAMALLLSSGFFFGCGACLIRRQRHEKEVSDLYRPQVDPGYGSKMRNDAYAGQQQQQQAALAGSTSLPAFHEYEHERDLDAEKGLEEVPLRQQNTLAYAHEAAYDAYGDDEGGGGGGGYGQRQGRPGQQLRFAPSDAGSMVGAGAGAPRNAAAAGAAGAGAQLAAEARAQRGRATQEDLRLLDATAAGAGSQSTTEVFTGMYDQGGEGEYLPTHSEHAHARPASYGEEVDPYYEAARRADPQGAYPYPSVSQSQSYGQPYPYPYPDSSYPPPASPTRLTGPRPPSEDSRSPTYYSQDQMQHHQQGYAAGGAQYPPAPQQQEAGYPYHHSSSAGMNMYGAPTYGKY